MNSITRLVLCGSALGATALSANTPLLTDPTNFGEGTSWFAGANQFQPIAMWQGFATLDAADRVSPSAGGSFTFSSWDDGTSDRIENFLFQEHNAGPPDGIWATTLFEAGDVIVFTGEASAIRSAPGVIARAFIKMLGFTDGNSHQTKGAYTEFFDLTETTQSFELRVTFPDLELDDSFQLLQIGFEIRTDFVAPDMQTGSITFSNLDAFIEGNGEPPPPAPTFGGMEVDASGHVDTGDFMGMLYVEMEPWVYVHDLARWVYMPDPGEDFTGAWAYIFAH